jgi:hypothetical protein
VLSRNSNFDCPITAESVQTLYRQVPFGFCLTASFLSFVLESEILWRLTFLGLSEVLDFDILWPIL